VNGVLRVEGIALWTPRLPGWEAARAVLRGDAEPPAAASARPAPALLAPTERRRAPDTVAIALEVAARACAASGRDPKHLPNVFASTHGDLAISDYMCATLASTPALISPTKFHNSVHNAAAGYWSIGTGCMEPSTALTAFAHTFAAGFIEAATQALCDATPVLYVAYDIAATGPMATVTHSRGLYGAALVLAPDGEARGEPHIHWQVEAAPDATARGNGRATLPRHAALVDGSPLAASLALFEALADERPARVRQTLTDRLDLVLDVEPCR
jgi:hypothetical protein